MAQEHAPSEQRATYEWERHSVGLVLSGGGGKGAYQIGCWKALCEAGLTRFSAVSGTSIGAVNAYLVARGDLKGAEKLWRRMGVRTPLPRSYLRLVVALVERYGLAVAYAILHAVFRPAVMLLTLLVVGLIVRIGSWLFPIGYPARAALFPFAVVCLIGFERLLRPTRLGRLSSVRDYSVRGMRRFTQVGMAGCVSLLFGILFGWLVPLAIVLYDLWHGYDPRWLVVLVPCLGLCALSVVLAAELGISSMGMIPLIAGGRLTDLLMTTLRRAPPLPKETAVFVTRLREEHMALPGRTMRVYSPGMVRDLKAQNPHLSNSEIRRYMLKSGKGVSDGQAYETVLGIEYVRLDGRPYQEACNLLQSSTAIAGFLPKVYERLQVAEEMAWLFSDERAVFYDAGMLDNVPLVPILEQGQCDLIIVVLLESGVEDPRGFLEKHTARLNDRIRRCNPDLDDEIYSRLENLALLRPVRCDGSRLRQVEILPIVPSRSLGGFFGGTLRFDLKRVEHLIDLGYRDTKRALDAFVHRKMGGTGESTSG